MTKKRTSVTIDEDVLEQIQEQGGNFSALVNRWTEEYIVEGRRPAMDREQIKTMLETLDDQEQELDAAREEFEDAYTGMKQTIQAHRETLLGALGNAPELEDLGEAIDELHAEQTSWEVHNTGIQRNGLPRQTTNPAIKSYAARLGITPERLVDELGHRDEQKREEIRRETEDGTRNTDGRNTVREDE